MREIDVKAVSDAVRELCIKANKILPSDLENIVREGVNLENTQPAKGVMQSLCENIDAAREHGIPIRIGVNGGSLEKDLLEKYGEPTPEALVESAMRHVAYLEKYDFPDFKVSVKASNVFTAVDAYRLLSKKIEQPLHLGITEAGGLLTGTVKSSVGLGMLLYEGIGDTIRVSLSADPVEEVKVGFEILKSLGIRSRGINFISCPTCSRREYDVIGVVSELEKRLSDISVPVDVAIIGCVVNGPGECETAEIGLAGARGKSGYYENGQRIDRIDNSCLVDELEQRIRAYAGNKARRLAAENA